MNTIVLLIIIAYSGDIARGTTTPVDRITITEMSNLQVCESVGKSIAGMSKYVKWNCIEGPR